MCSSLSSLISLLSLTHFTRVSLMSVISSNISLTLLLLAPFVLPSMRIAMSCIEASDRVTRNGCDATVSSGLRRGIAAPIVLDSGHGNVWTITCVQVRNGASPVVRGYHRRQKQRDEMGRRVPLRIALARRWKYKRASKVVFIHQARSARLFCCTIAPKLRACFHSPKDN